MVETKAEIKHESRTRLLDAALRVIRARGYSAARVEDICEAAGLTKGSFFHHFKSKEELGLAAVQRWIDLTGGFFASSDYHRHSDPLDRLLAYIDLRRAMLRGDLADFTCLAGTMIQELYETHPAMRDACHESVTGHAGTLEPDIAEAMRLCGVEGDWTPRSLALYTQAVIQGAFILAKAGEGASGAAACLGHLRRYIQLLFDRPVSYAAELAQRQSEELMRLQQEEQI